MDKEYQALKSRIHAMTLERVLDLETKIAHIQEDLENYWGLCESALDHWHNEKFSRAVPVMQLAYRLRDLELLFGFWDRVFNYKDELAPVKQQANEEKKVG